MYEFEGDIFSTEDLNKIAAAKGYTFEELLSKNPSIKKTGDEKGKPTSQGQGAPVAETVAPENQTQPTGSTLENGSLVSIKNNSTDKNTQYKSFLKATEVDADEIKDSYAESYFNLDGLVRETINTPRGVEAVKPLQEEIKSYLGEEKYQEYTKYKETSDLYIPEDISENIKANIKIQKAQNHFETISEEQRNTLSTSLDDAFSSIEVLKEKSAEYAESQKSFESLYSKKIKDFEEKKKAIKDYENLYGGPIINDLGYTMHAPRVVQEYSALVDDYKQAEGNIDLDAINKDMQGILKKQSSLLELSKSVEPVIKNAQSISAGLSAAKLNYSNFDLALSTLEKTFLGLGADYGARALELLISDDNVLLNEKALAIEADAKAYNRSLIREHEQNFPKGISIEDVNTSNIGEFALNALAENSLSLVLAATSGGTSTAAKAGVQGAARAAKLAKNAATAIFFGSSTLDKYTQLEMSEEEATKVLPELYKQLETESDAEEISNIQESINYFENKLSYSEMQKVASSILTGGIEAYAERIGTLRSIEGLMDMRRVIGASPFKKAVYSMGNIGKAIGVEELEETATLLGQNLVDISVLEENKSLGEGLDLDFLAKTAITSFAISAPSTMGGVRSALKNEFSTRAEKKQNRRWLNELGELQEEVEIARNSGNKKTVALLNKKKNQILNEAGLADMLSLHKLKAMSTAEISKVFDLSRQERQTLRDLKELGKSGLRGEAGQKIKDDLLNKYNSIQEQKDEIIDTAKNRKRKEAELKIKQALKSEGETLVNEAEISYNIGLYELTKDIAKQVVGKNGTYIVASNRDELQKATAKLSKQQQDEILNKYDSKDSNAFINGNVIVVDEVSVLSSITNRFSKMATGGQQYAAVSPLHEALHLAVSNLKIKKGDKLNASFNNAVKQAKDVLKTKVDTGKISKENYDSLNNRFKLYDGTGENIQLEETFNAISDAIALGVLDVSDIENSSPIKNLINSVNRSISPSARLASKLETGEDVFRFLKNYNKKAFSRKLKISGDEEKKLDSLIKESKQTVASEKVQKIYDEEGINGWEQISNEYKAMANNIANVYRDRPGFETYKEDLIDGILNDPTYGVLGLTLNYKPNENEGVPLAAYINKYLKARSITLANQLLGKDEASTFKSDVTEVKDVMATETAEDAIMASEEIAKEKPKKQKPKLKEKITLEEEVKQKFSETLFKVVALNVKKFDVAKGQNQTIPTFVADIKTDLAELFEKPMATFIKSYGAEQFFIENRENFLNNFTTTFLSKHPFFRKGILKRVNGEWVAPTKISAYKYDWVDANGNKLKIDRDNAAGRGLTSGPEFIKRNPNILNIIKENEFVDYHYQDGALRKKLKQNPIKSIARQVSSEMGLEILQEDLLENGVLTQAIAERAGLAGLINTFSQTQAEEYARGIDRGLTKLSAISTGIESIIERNTPISNEGISLAVNFGVDSIKYKDYINSLDEKDKSYVSNIVENNLGIIQNFQDSLQKDRGLKYEEAVKNLTGAIGKKYPNAKIELVNEKNIGGYSNKGAGDLNIGINGKIVNIELKLNSLAQMGSFTAKLSSDGKVSFTADGLNVAEELAAKINSPEIVAARKDYLQTAKKLIKEAGSKYSEDLYDLTSFPPTVPYEIREKLTGLGKLKALSFDLELNNADLINKHYLNKGVHYIQIGDKGLYRTGDADPMNLGEAAPLLKGKIVLKSRMVAVNKTQEKFKNKLGDKTNYKYSFTNRVFYSLNEDIEASKISFDSAIDIKSMLDHAAKKGQEANKTLESRKSSNTLFNEMLQRKKGISANDIVSKTTATLAGRGKGKYKLFIPPGAEDFEGFLYAFLGSGKQGEQDYKFFKEKLLDPIARANYDLNFERQVLKANYANLIKNNKGINKILKKESDYKFYSNDAAVRVWMWNKLGYDIPNLNDSDIKNLLKVVEENPDLLKFSKELIETPNKKESWQKPNENWAASTAEMDYQEILSKVGRARIFSEFIENSDIIFSKDNLNKIEAVYGTEFRNNLEDIIYRIKKGKSREFGTNGTANKFLNWVRGSINTTMFFNMRSALLQQLSIVNFTNFSDNNPIAQAKVLANPKEYGSAWVEIFNSDWMKERRQGLKTDINEAELVQILETSKDGFASILRHVLQKGFILTKYGDNIAIATGGAPFLINRTKKYIKEGMSEKDAKNKAFLDFQEIAEKTQQSSRQDLLSNQQVSVVGRLFLAFQNTPMQYARLTKKAALDLINGRGDAKTHIAKIAYYGAAQNMIFSFLQNALFASFFSEDEDDEKVIDSKTERAINNTIDGFLRGTGVAGGIVATLKNAAIRYAKENDKGWKGDKAYVMLELLNVAPPVGIKARKLYGAMKSYDINKKIAKDISYSNPAHPYFGIIGSGASAAFNIPLDRIMTKMKNLKEAMNSENEAWQRTALFLGYNTWDLGLKDKEIERAREMSSKRKKKKSKKNW